MAAGTFGLLRLQAQVVAIDQKGAPGRPKQTRLYIYAYEKDQTLYLITIGDKDKDSQRRDLKDSRDFVTDLKEGA